MSLKKKAFSPENNSLLYRFAVKGCPDDNKERRIKRVNTVMTALAGSMIAFSLIRALTAYGSLPDELGVHFLGLRYIKDETGYRDFFRLMFHGGKQEYDVYGPKLWIFYPHLISSLAFLGSKLSVWLFGKLGKQSRMDGFKKSKLKQGLTLSLDMVTLDLCMYFCIIWNECILRQTEMRMIFTYGYALVAILCFFEMINFTLTLNRLTKDKPK